MIIAGIKLQEKAFATDELSGEDIEYVAKVLKMISYRKIEYWCGDAEVRERKPDHQYSHSGLQRNWGMKKRKHDNEDSWIIDETQCIIEL